MWLRQKSQGMRNREKAENWINVLRKREGNRKGKGRCELCDSPSHCRQGRQKHHPATSPVAQIQAQDPQPMVQLDGGRRRNNNSSGSMYGKGTRRYAKKGWKRAKQVAEFIRVKAKDRTQIQWKSLILLLLKWLGFWEAEEGNWFHSQANYPTQGMFVY